MSHNHTNKWDVIMAFRWHVLVVIVFIAMAWGVVNIEDLKWFFSNFSDAWNQAKAMPRS